MKTPQPAQSGSLHPICSAWVAVSSALPQPDEDVLLWGILDCETRHGCHKGCRKATGYGHEWFESVTSPDGCNHDEITSVSHWMPLPCEPNVADQTPAAQDSAHTTDAPAGCLHPFCSPPFAVGLRPTPITESFEQWWGEHGGKCEALIANIGVKAAVERGFFAGYVSSDSTLNKLDSAASSHS